MWCWGLDTGWFDRWSSAGSERGPTLRNTLSGRQTKACEGILGHQVEGNDVTVSSEDSQNEARATGFSVMNSRRAMELLARFTLKIHNRLSLSNCKPLNNKLLCQWCGVGCWASPVKGGHRADGEQHVEQRLGGVSQAVVLLQQVGQSGEVPSG